MKLRVAFQMDRIDNINIDQDTTFRLAEKAQELNHEIFYYNPENLFFSEGKVFAKGHYLTINRDKKNFFNLHNKITIDLEKDFDVIWLRQDPPFDMAYITSTHLLDLVSKKTLVINDPFWVRNLPEKIFVLSFADLTPPTLISKNVEEIKIFLNEHKKIVIKPLFGNGGADVFKVNISDPNLNSILEVFNQKYKEPFIIQKFLSEIKNGDKRVILVDGKPVGAINRLPQKGEIRSNMHVGGIAKKTNLTVRDKEICQKIGNILKKRGQLLVGIDIIGDFLTEINLTSPTGIQEIEKYENIDISQKIWDVITKKVKMLN